MYEVCEYVHVYMPAHMHADARAHVCICVWKAEVDARFLSSVPHHLIFRIGCH